ncbi:hypothetical protein [Lysobacter capsici]|uniref:hypothetical protein n=1 Tax=Lysobacter capsici TaxID=435897 RepID=UPI00044F32B8|nr:hypothetical protein [Lysobacter capsici]
MESGTKEKIRWATILGALAIGALSGTLGDFITWAVGEIAPSAGAWLKTDQAIPNLALVLLFLAAAIAALALVRWWPNDRWPRRLTPVIEMTPPVPEPVLEPVPEPVPEPLPEPVAAPAFVPNEVQDAVIKSLRWVSGRYLPVDRVIAFMNPPTPYPYADVEQALRQLKRARWLSDVIRGGGYAYKLADAGLDYAREHEYPAMNAAALVRYDERFERRY